MDQAMVTFIQNWGPTGVLVVALLLLARSVQPLITALVDELKSTHATSDRVMARFQESDARWSKSEDVVEKAIAAQKELATQMTALTTGVATLTTGIGNFSLKYDSRAQVIDELKREQTDHINASALAATEIKTILNKVDTAIVGLATLLNNRDTEVVKALEAVVTVLGETRTSLAALAPKPAEAAAPVSPVTVNVGSAGSPAQSITNGSPA